MSEANLQLARRVFDEPDLGDTDETELRSVFHPDVEFLPRRSGTEGAYRGIDGIAKFVADTREVFERFEVHYELLDLGERALAWGKISLRARASGIETDVSMGGIFEFRDGKIVRWEDFGSKERALEVMGLEG
jgi:ketosteroid isomerase-like protein